MTTAWYGARPLRRAAERLVEDSLSELLLSHALTPGMKVHFSYIDGKLTVTDLPAVTEAPEEAPPSSLLEEGRAEALASSQDDLAP